MPRAAFLTLDNPEGYSIDDGLAHAPLAALGWAVDDVPWRRAGVDWGSYDAIVIRSPWDYHHDPEAFLSVLEGIEASGTQLLNGLPLVRWNLRKTYLRDLADRGVPTIPTVWRDRLAPGSLAPLLAEVGTEEAVIKPVVSATAVGAFRLDAASAATRTGEVEAYYADRALMAQPMARAVVDEGEYSLFYFNGAHSHTILKTPRAGDFRVQEEHGGHLQLIEAEGALREAGDRALAAIGDDPPLYARADLVRANDGGAFWLMELELIEPSLYLRMDPGAPARFARALHERVLNPRG
ncbi:MAG TPA: hypothetical protein VK610_05490 [Rhodothermales bacterium]|nr:hypothetical protein [Rhodothermales bacterium]